MGEVESEAEIVFVDAVQTLIAFITAGDVHLKQLESQFLQDFMERNGQDNQELQDAIFKRKGELVVAYVERV